MIWSSSCGRIELNITKQQAESCSHPGQCDDDVARLILNPKIRRQLNKLEPVSVVRVLDEYGCWSTEELENSEDNFARLIWIACCDITERL